MREEEYTTLKLKVLIRTDDCYLVDLGTGKVWLDREAVRSMRRIGQGIYEVEVLSEVIESKRQEMRGLKERVTGVRGSVLGDVLELEGKILKEEPDAIQIEVDGTSLFFPRFCFSEIQKTDEDRYRFVVQRNFYEFKLRVLKKLDPKVKVFSEVEAKIIQETDRAYFLEADGRSIWYPKRGILKMSDSSDPARKIFKVPTDFWRFKLAGGGY